MAVLMCYKLTDLETGQTQPLGSCGGDHYLLASGKEIRVHSEIGWCPACDNFKAMESLETVEVLQRQLETYQASARGSQSRTANSRRPDEVLPKMIEELILRIVWRMNRIAPPKCLTCGSTRASKVPLGIPIAHPRWGNMVRVDLGETVAMRLCYEPRYTPEGDEIERPRQA